MAKQRNQRIVAPELFLLRDRFVAVTGTIESVTPETNIDQRKIDHVWIEVRAGAHGLLQIAVNTHSSKSAEAGYDERVRLGIITSTWTELPAAGMRLVESLDYATIEATRPIDFFPYDRVVLEELLVRKAEAACFAQGWGDFYVRAHLGVHQIHSRRSSFAHHVDHQGKDGALELYFYKEQRRELLLLKFAGQP